ncbi:MAG: hypothetical protein MUP22_13105, partial [Desulfobacterales bacterium]|nr:hypothetical protein [Desulfobacterales bacterium]
MKYFSISKSYIFLTATTKPVIFTKGMLFSPQIGQRRNFFFDRIYRDDQDYMEKLNHEGENPLFLATSAFLDSHLRGNDGHLCD